MVGLDKNTPVLISNNIKNLYPYIPIFILLNNNNDIELYKNKGT